MSFVKIVNIGNTLSDKLMKAGIKDVETLRSLGSWKAFLKIREFDSSVCYSLLCALEGAVRNVRWHQLDESVKQDLRRKLDELEGEC